MERDTDWWQNSVTEVVTYLVKTNKLSRYSTLLCQLEISYWVLDYVSHYPHQQLKLGESQVKLTKALLLKKPTIK